MTILSIVGARPQFIKEAVIQREISKRLDVKEIVVHTGQHYDENMSGAFFEVLKMKEPDYNLGIQSCSHSEMTGQMMIELEKVIAKEEPEAVLLYGDTNSTLAGALVCAKMKIKTAHIEAGLRQLPRDMPEEINRVIIDRISDFLFVPSDLSAKNLKAEGIENNVFIVGDVMYDLYSIMCSKFDYSLIRKLGLEKNNYIIMTLHRDFNVDNKKVLANILNEVNRISKECKVVFPVHPRTKARIEKFGLNNIIKDVFVIEPLDYLKLMGLTQNAYKIITDSGGYQKEAYFASKSACVIMPDTGWRELIEIGVNKLVQPSNLYKEVFSNERHQMPEEIYGDGNAAKKIIDILFEDPI